VTYADKTRRQDVEKEPSDKLVGLEGHGLLTVMVGIVAPEERNLAALKGE